MAASNIRLVLEELRTRLLDITTANGFNTDAGNNVFLGESAQLGPDDDGTAIVIDVGDVAVGEQGLGARSSSEEFPTRLLVSVQAIAQVATLAQPWVTVENIRADIKKAVETGEAWPTAMKEITRTAERALEREEGNLAVGAEVEYSFLLLETWGVPDA